MRTGAVIIVAWGSPPCAAQVHVGAPLRFTGPMEERGVDGLAPPTDPSSVVTLGYAWAGRAHWADALRNADTLHLTMVPRPLGPSEVGLVRFIAPPDPHGIRFLRLDNMPAKPFMLFDGLPPAPGAILSGQVVEAVAGDGGWILTHGARPPCPPATLPVNGRFCISVGDVPGLDFFQASSHCAHLGGKLCTWDEYHAGCVLLGGQLNGMFDNWEWIDGSGDHTHTADQTGMSTCTDHRAVGPFQAWDARCCFRIRQ